MSDVFVAMVRDHAQRLPHQPALADSDRSYTWQELDRAVKHRARALPAAHEMPTPVVALHRPGDCEWVVDFLALRSNGVTVISFPSATPLASVLRQAAEIRAAGVVAGRGELTPCRPDGSTAPAPWWRDISVVQLTSGTTGEALGVPRSEENLLDEARSVAEALKLTPSSPVLCGTPVAHSFASGLFLAALVTGAPTVLVPFFQPAAVSLLAERHRPRLICGTPYVFRSLMRDRRRSGEALSRVEIPMTGGAPLHEGLAGAWLEQFGVPLVQEYGLSEGGIATMNLSHSRQFPTSVGPAVPGVDIHVVDDQGRVLGPGVQGHIVIRRRGNPTHYVGAGGTTLPTPSRTPTEGAEIDTGDLGRLDERGLLYLSGRTKAVINVAGAKVSPRSVESALLEHHTVDDVVVLGVPDDQRGEAVAAVVEGDPDTVSVEHLAGHLRERLSPVMVPRRWHVVPRLPRTASGKPDLRAIRLHFDKDVTPC
ncbi:class I adenylate-forming enzyme family protein [Streptomyces phyllanthi]|uniref:Long-chain fatty acid--CoA ligase n=1 Tax=Streptomyces phyllanthi TaxID=1803180 RepID=A0A5N8VW93_9ACTN|nr:fatty acid--CoA ligase family protein [Streptomyces phyllanthi]MPY38966.1 long-chain fatty acid--CoA ligase [Streptomyces phyllanthi]